MLWLLRTGKDAKYYEDFIKHKRIYMCWEGYDDDLSAFTLHQQFIDLVSKEPGNDNNVSKRNRASQLEYFCNHMKIGDYVLLPNHHGKEYALVKVSGNYEYKTSHSVFPHSRKVDIIKTEIQNSLFSQNEKYALGAYRTLYHIKDEAIIRKIAKKCSLIFEEEEK